jgi:hypothetical protein
MYTINGVEFENDNRKAVEILKKEKLYGTFLSMLKITPMEQTYIVMSDKNEKRNLYCAYFRNTDKLGQSGYSITIIRDPLVNMEYVRRIESKLYNNKVDFIHVHNSAPFQTENCTQIGQFPTLYKS